MRRIFWIVVTMLSVPLIGCGGGGGSATDDTSTTPPPTVTVDKGSLNLTLIGLPNSANGSATVTGPSGYSKQVSGSTTLSELEVGEYTVTPVAVTVDGIVFDVQPASFSTTISKNTTSSLDLVYQSDITSQGIVTNFGSVFVNGVRYDTSSALFKDEAGDASSESDFSVGMLVTVKGRAGANGEGAKAEQITYDLKAKGKVESVSLSNSTVTVLGLEFVVTESTEFENTTLETLQVNDVVKVSAIKNDQGQLVATHIEKESDTSLFVLRGTATLLDTDASTFSLDNLVVNYAQAEIIGTLLNDSLVVVYSEQAAVNGELVATKVKVLETDNDSSSGQYAIDGVVTSIVGDNQFVIAGLSVTWNDETQLFGGTSADIQVGARLKVHGAKTDEQFIVRKIRFDKSGIIALKGAIENIDLDAKTITILATTFTLDAHSKLKDKSRFKVRRITLDNLAVGDVIAVKAFLSSQEQTLLAKQVTRLVAIGDGQTNMTEVEGKVTAVSDNQFAVRGVTVVTNEVSEFEYNDESVERTVFFLQLKVGDKVEVKGLRQEDKTVLAQEVEAKASVYGDKQLTVKLTGAISDFVSIEAFTLNGRMIKTNEFTRFEDGTSSDLANGVLIEVKGNELDDGAILASKIDFERHDDLEELELKGQITDFNSAADFTVNNQKVTTTENTEFRGGSAGDLQLNMWLEIEGTLNASGILVADKIKFEDENEQMTLSGVISEFVSTTQFNVNGKPVTTTSNTRYDNGNESRLADGVQVKVEGTTGADSVLVASKIKFDSYAKVELQGEITSTAENEVSLNEMRVKYSTRTEFEKGKHSDLAVGVTIKVEGRQEDANTVIAEEIKFISQSTGREVDFEGRVSRFESVTNFAVGSRNVTTDANTLYKNGSASKLKQNVKVEIKGVLQVNNVVLAHEVKFDD